MVKSKGTKFLAAVFITVVLLSTAGCSFRSDSRSPKVTAPWRPGEVATMTVYHEGRTVGTSVLSVARVDDHWQLNVETTADGHGEQVTVLANGETLQPIRVELAATDGKDELQFKGEYGLEQVDVELTSSQGDRSYFVELPKGDFYDNEQFMFLLRALPLEDEWQGGVNLVVTRSASQAILGIWVVDEAVMDTPLGPIDTWVVEVRGINQFAWIEKEPPHRLVRYENKAEETVTVLEDYHRGGD